MHHLIRNRRSMIAAVSGAVVSAIASLRGEDQISNATGHRRGRRQPSPELTCDGTPRRNKCKKGTDCCSGLCDRKAKRCTYKNAGQGCGIDAHCLPPFACVSGICGVRPTATPEVTPTVTPTDTATPDPCVAPGADTLQAAIDAATPGSNICLKAGTYTASSGSYVGVVTKNLSITGVGEDQTFIDGAGVRAGIGIGLTDHSSQITVNLFSLTIKNGYSTHGGSGVHVWGRYQLLLQMMNVTVKDGTNGSGIFMDTAPDGMPTASLTNVTITNNNAAPSFQSGGAMTVYGRAVLTDCVVSNNQTQMGGGGLNLLADAVVTMSGGSLTGNTANYSGNTSDGNGGGFRLRSSSATFSATNTTITGNRAFGRGGLGYVEPSGDHVTLTGCTVSGNTADTACGCVYQASNSTCSTGFCQ